jgi:uncharacterized protein (DUF2252 family)
MELPADHDTRADDRRDARPSRPAERPLSLGEAQEAGRALRARLPRRDLAAFEPAAGRDPVAVLASQNEDRVADLVPIRVGRMLQSPFAYLRGSAAVMAADLAGEARTGAEVVICGDAHLANFGLHAAPDRRVLFDVNDFDETAFGPWEWDVKRLACSAVVAGRHLGFSPADCRAAATSAARTYRTTLHQLFTRDALQRYYHRVETDWLEAQSDSQAQKVVRRAIRKAQRRTSDRVLSKITTVDADGSPRIIDEFPIIRHDDAWGVERASEIFDTYRATVDPDVELLLRQFRVVDSVLRIVGVGSVGTRCFIALLLGPSGEPLFLQTKEAPPSVLVTYGLLPDETARGRAPGGPGCQGRRVVTGQRALQAASDRFLGWMDIDGRDYYCRQFRDMKGSIELEGLSPSQLSQYSALCGSVIARSHAQSPDAAVVSAYLGRSDRFEQAIATWANASADQTERDYAALEAAVAEGRMLATLGV